MTTIAAENAKQIRQAMDVLITITPEQGDPIVINNSNLIDAVVSLRSDLSPINPTLPESDIEIHAYCDEDISETLAEIPNETPLTYQAGYAGDMSPVRKFYISEQITWADNVMTIKAVDAVYKFGKTTEPTSVGDTDCVKTEWEYGNGLYQIMTLFYYYALNAGVDAIDYESIPQIALNPYWTPCSGTHKGIRQKRGLIGRGHTYRDIIAEIMNCFHFSDIDSQFIRRYAARWENFWPTYVDAGIPKLTMSKPTSTWDIYENDCGDTKRNNNRKIKSIKATLYDTNSAAIVDYVTRDLNFAKNSVVGSFNWEKDSGGKIDMQEEYVFAFVIGVAKEDIGETPTTNIRPIIPVDEYGWPGVDTPVYSFYIGNKQYDFNGHKLVDSQSLHGSVYVNRSGGQYILYTQEIPWNSEYKNISQSGLSYKAGWRTQADAWAGLVSSGVINADTTQATLNIYGFSMNESIYEETFNSAAANGTEETIEPLFHGHVWMTNECGDDDDPPTEPTTIVEAFPQKAIESLMARSNVTGSFTWKGDPRMQPRDVFTFHRLDGTTEECTLENITITHSGGGTSAEITYRKGIC